MASLPPVAPFPKQAWRQQLSAREWDALVDAWTALSTAWLSLADAEFLKRSKQDESIAVFVATFTEDVAASSVPNPTAHSAALLKAVYQLAARLLKLSPPPALLEFDFLANFAKAFSKKHAAPAIASLFENHASAAEASLTPVKKLLIPHLDAGIRGDLKLVESHLIRLNHILHVSPHACTLFLAGSDFFDGLVVCFRVMNPPLRKAIVTTTYLCLVGLTAVEPPKWAMLSDQLYSMKAAADAHKQGPTNANDSLVPELITTTPILKLLLRRAEASGAASENLKKRINALEVYRKGPMVRPKRLVKRRVDKGKGKESGEEAQAEMHIHRMSQIALIQDLFPDLGAGFVSKCLDEYGDDTEQVVANLLSETLPSHLATADRSEPLSTQSIPTHSNLAPRSTPPLPPTRHNRFDDDEFDRLAVDTSKFSFGKKPGKTADQLLQDKSEAPNKAAILSALAAFDSDDDERDDTYDAADVGGTVDASNQEADGVSNQTEEVLFRAWQMDAKVFDRDAATRRGPARDTLRKETGMADEALEGWAVMLTRNPQQQRKLQAKYAFSGQQEQVDRTSWRASAPGSGAEDNDRDGNNARGGRGGRGRGRGGRGRGRGGSVAGPTGEKETESARRNKEANKGSRANHNRRDARAKKMARAGFAG
ncbi:CUE domain-containing protein [Paramyrothecium foliicola]|nr:CUE domain-containing protein [Paramyrothecium foliicola]